uniref:Arc-like DNA binding domain-containing protein n=1 Tax=Chlorobium phaeobacteroides (strain BS1) TaxID=331678 RepID=B3EMD5_CHLPB
MNRNDEKTDTMPLLQVKDFPENMYSLLQQQAKAEHRSFSQEIVVTLAKGLNHKARRAQLLQEIEQNTDVPEKVVVLDPVELIREDRER